MNQLAGLLKSLPDLDLLIYKYFKLIISISILKKFNFFSCKKKKIYEAHKYILKYL